MGVIIQVELPEKLAEQANQLVTDGYVLSVQGAITEALSRYISSHDPSITEKLIMEEVERGLYGES